MKIDLSSCFFVSRRKFGYPPYSFYWEKRAKATPVQSVYCRRVHLCNRPMHNLVSKPATTTSHSTIEEGVVAVLDPENLPR